MFTITIKPLLSKWLLIVVDNSLSLYSFVELVVEEPVDSACANCTVRLFSVLFKDFLRYLFFTLICILCIETKNIDINMIAYVRAYKAR